MSESQRIARVPPNTLYRELEGETVLLQLDNGEYFGLDEVGTRIWQLIVEKGDLQQVETAMMEEFAVDRDVISKDLTRVVDDLVAKGLLEIEIAAPPNTP